MAVGVATLARSQYLVYDLTNSGQERIGLGGKYISEIDPPKPEPVEPGNQDEASKLGSTTIIVIAVVLFVLLGVGVYFFRRHR